MRMLDSIENLGRSTTRGLDELGFGFSLLTESLYWLFVGWRQKQAVRLSAIVAQMMEIGILALPIATLLTATIGAMLAIQGIYSLRLFGAESYVYVGVALAVTREFAPLIIGILVAGRSGSALAARISAMVINQEIDALRAIGIYPARFLVAPALVATVIMVPLLTIWGNVVALSSAGMFISLTLDISFGAYVTDLLGILRISDIVHGLMKSAVFGLLIVMIAVVNGALVKGGAEGVGQATTRSVVHALSAIIFTDLFLVTMGAG